MTTQAVVDEAIKEFYSTNERPKILAQSAVIRSIADQAVDDWHRYRMFRDDPSYAYWFFVDEKPATEVSRDELEYWQEDAELTYKASLRELTNEINGV